MLALVLSALFYLVAVQAATNPLGPYSVSDITVSGISAGGYMAVQTHIAYSSLVNGSAVFAGGPYFCAQDNLMYAEYKCMKVSSGLPDITTLVTITKSNAASGLIDPVSNLADDRVYLFSGTDDSVVNPKVVQTLETYYNNFVSPTNIVGDFNIAAEHCQPTVNYGEDCSVLGSPYIGKCDFDGAGYALQTLYPSIKTSTSQVSKNLYSFSQTPYMPSTKASIGDVGYIYVPSACASGTKCHLHISFHGCEQTVDDIGNQYATDSGYNEWAEANNIIVLYPYAKRSLSFPSNPNGCWDWWGYTDKNYATQKGIQPQFVRNLITAVTGK